MTPHYSDDSVTLYHGDCLEVLRELPDSSVDSIVTDPPYGLGFMGREWDGLPPGEPWARECLRVLKPGGHLLAFGGTRTWHRLACAVEDAGFEIRDSIAWLYGSGFPKSLDVSKAIDKRRDWSLVERLSGEIRRARAEAGLSLAEVGQATLDASDGTYGKWYHRGGHMFFETGRSLPSRPEWDHLRHVLPIAPEFVEVYDEAEREVTGQHRAGNPIGIYEFKHGEGKGRTANERRDIPATPDAARWQGWGTALKPAFEPIVVGRKPLAGTVAGNVLTHGTGALNIDACRVEGEVPSVPQPVYGVKADGVTRFGAGSGRNGQMSSAPGGRWPTNVALDDSQAVELGDPAKFFPTFRYESKAPKRERPVVDGVAHPTVKPLGLMRWLVRLVTPPGGVVLDPFAGSGTTLEAAKLEGFAAVGIEREAEYLPLIEQRISRAS